jgi:predicted RNA-binding Zn ribbon-like protein
MTTTAPLLGEPLPVELMNTIWADRDGLHDVLDSAAGLSGWLSAVASSQARASSDASRAALEVPADLVVPVLPQTLNRSVLADFTALRDALRVLAAAITEDTRPGASHASRDLEQAVATVNRSCAAAPSWSQLSWPDAARPRRGSVTASGPAESALSWIAERAAELLGSGQAAELRACQGPGCVLYFLRDHPRREWCSAGCGNRARVARHYARHRGR